MWHAGLMVRKIVCVQNLAKHLYKPLGAFHWHLSSVPLQPWHGPFLRRNDPEGRRDLGQRLGRTDRKCSALGALTHCDRGMWVPCLHRIQDSDSNVGSGKKHEGGAATTAETLWWLHNFSCFGNQISGEHLFSVCCQEVGIIELVIYLHLAFLFLSKFLTYFFIIIFFSKSGYIETYTFRIKNHSWDIRS